MLNFLNQFPFHSNPVALFGITLLLGLFGAELAKRTKVLPSISGYIAVGFLIGPNCFDIATPQMLSDSGFFVDIALGLILFDLGRHLDFRWLMKDKGLVLISLAESLLTFFSIFGLLIYFKFPWLSSALAATIATATSPAVVMMVAHDIGSRGPVTRRTMILTSLNNLFALIIFTILLPVTHISASSVGNVTGNIAYRLLGSMSLGLIMFVLTMCLTWLTGKNKESQFVLFVGAVSLSIGLTIAFNLSTMLTLFTLGVVSRNLDVEHRFMEIDFGWVARLFFILLFVVTGIYLKINGLWQSIFIVLGFLILKILAKIVGVLLFRRQSRLTLPQSLALGCTLMPMAELAIGMSNRLVYYNPGFSQELLTIITTIIAIFYIIGPIVVQYVLIKSGESAVESV